MYLTHLFVEYPEPYHKHTKMIAWVANNFSAKLAITFRLIEHRLIQRKYLQIGQETRVKITKNETYNYFITYTYRAELGIVTRAINPAPNKVS